MDKECCACFRNSNIVNSFLGHPFFNRLVFLSPLDNKIGRNHCCIAFRRTALRHWRHREDQNETGTKKKRWHWGENASTVHRHQINDKMKKKKINYISYLVEPRKRKKKEIMVFWTWGQWNQKQSATLSLSFLTVRLDFASKGKREDRLKSKLNQQAVQKKKNIWMCR